MNYEEVTFDNFLSLDKQTQGEILNDFSKLQYLIKNNVNEQRYIHSLSVAQTCVDLGKFYDLDQKQCYMAGLLHDCCKFNGEDCEEKTNKMIKHYCPWKMDNIYPAYHSYIAPFYLRDKLNYNDERVLRAIFNHTILKDDDTLSLILYIADKREPNRRIHDSILRIAETDLKKAYELLQEDVKKYIESKNEGFIKGSI